MDPSYVFKANFRYMESYFTRTETICSSSSLWQVKSTDAASLSRSSCSATASSLTVSQIHVQKWQLLTRSGKSQLVSFEKKLENLIF